jgi:hypothetical protein
MRKISINPGIIAKLSDAMEDWNCADINKCCETVLREILWFENSGEEFPDIVKTSNYEAAIINKHMSVSIQHRDDIENKSGSLGYMI